MELEENEKDKKTFENPHFHLCSIGGLLSLLSCKEPICIQELTRPAKMTQRPGVTKIK
jgi:hypothetical protein